MPQPKICIVTIHGIGFQQPPLAGSRGYADDLHQSLAAALPDMVSDDPSRQPYQTGASVPIYVSSRWPVDGGTAEEGLKRLGSWTEEGTISRSPPELFQDHRTIAHVALVYSNLEDLGAQPVAAADSLFMALAELHRYGHVLSVLRMLFADGVTAAEEDLKLGRSQAAPPSLARRMDVPRPAHHILHVPFTHDRPTQPGGIAGTVLQVEEDICAYVCRNDSRTRVRDFARDALLRLASRQDVDLLIVNTHSNGTVIGLDSIRGLPADADKLGLFITAGSPLRKYAELFLWGGEVGTLKDAKRWINFVDPKDPVADPLAHPRGWAKADQPLAESDIFYSQPPSAKGPIPMVIQDVIVDNVHQSSGGGLQAHNYWDNTTEFVSRLRDELVRLSLPGARLG